MPECRRKVSPASAFLPVVSCFSPASAFQYQGWERYRWSRISPALPSYAIVLVFVSLISDFIISQFDFWYSDSPISEKNAVPGQVRYRNTEISMPECRCRWHLPWWRRPLLSCKVASAARPSAADKTPAAASNLKKIGQNGRRDIF